MEFAWDPEKAALGLAKHGVAFEEIREFNWMTAFDREDTRYDYGEGRRIALGLIGDRLHVVAYTLREGTVRIIMLRKANSREERIYASETASRASD